MATLSQIRQALAQTIESGVESSVNVYGQVVLNGALPAVMVEPSTVDFDHSFQRGTDSWTFNLFVLVSPTSYSGGQDQLDAFIDSGGPDSIRSAIYHRSDLGLGDDISAHVTGMRGYNGSFDWAGPEHIGAILTVTVLSDGRP